MKKHFYEGKVCLCLGLGLGSRVWGLGLGLGLGSRVWGLGLGLGRGRGLGLNTLNPKNDDSSWF